MKEQFVARVWTIGGAYIINIPKKLVKLFKIKKDDYYRVTLESLRKR